MDGTVPSPFAPGRIGPLTLRNRIIKSATFEGMSPGGAPSHALVEFHRRLAAGGVGMTTLAYVAVDRRGRTFADQIVMSSRVTGALAELVAAVHREGALASVQLTHCGAFTKDRSAGMPRAPSFGINVYGLAHGLPLARAMSIEEIDEVVSSFGRAASLAREAGFDAVELHLGHGYLLSQFLSPASNVRADEYGGSLTNRLRLPLRVVEHVRETVPDVAVLAKINLSDGFEGGLELDESVQIARALAQAGVDAIVPSGGFTSRNAFHLLRGRAPIPEMVAAERHPLQRLALRVMGPRVIQSEPFEELFFLDSARMLCRSVPIPVVLLGGVVSRRNLDTAMAHGFQFAAVGRALIADPDWVTRVERGEIERSRCNACNACVALMENGGVRCVLDDPSFGATTP